LQRLAARLEMEQPKVEESMGKPMEALTRVEAKEWIKRFRDMTDSAAPGSKVRFGQWPGSREDREAVYLEQYRDLGTPFSFKLFNGEEFKGPITDFTPYTITVKVGDGEDLVLRKLAVAYYRQLPDGAMEEEQAPAKPARASRAKKSAGAEETPVAETPAATAEAPAEQHQPVADAFESDRVGEATDPEADSMDEDRGI